MGKCISKHPSVLTIALSEKDLANTNQIWSKFSESTEYITLKNDTKCWHGNQLCVHESNYFVSIPVGVKNHQQSQQQEYNNARKSKMCGRVDSVPRTGLMRSLKNAEEGEKIEELEEGTEEEKSNVPKVTVSLDDIMTVRAVSTRHKFERRKTSKINLNSMINIDATYTLNSSMSNSIINNEGDDRRHDFEYEYDDVVGYNYPYSDSYDVNIGQNDGQHCLAHLNLLENGSQPVTTAKCNQRIWYKHARKYNKNSYKSTAHDKEFKNIKNIQNKRRFSEGNLVEIALNKNMFQNNIGANDKTQGQAESKKSSKKYSTNAIETKGTAMSFGFHKKLTSTPKKLKKLIENSVGDTKSKHDKCNNLKETSRECTTKEITEVEVKEHTTTSHENKDNNGNTDETPNQIQFEKMGAAAWLTTQKAMPTNQGVSSVQHSNLPGANNRFGFRGIIRPASTGIASRYDKKDNASNNNSESTETRPSCLVSNLKRRSKSAHAGRALTSDQSDDVDADGNRVTDVLAAPPKIAQPKTLTFNLSHNSTIEYQRQQFFQQPPTSIVSGRIGRTGSGINNVYQQQHQQQQYQNIVNTGMHTNVIVRPTPRAPPATFSKFTLHTTSLPKPEFPIAISLSTATTPTTPGCIFSPSSGCSMTTASSIPNTVNSSGGGGVGIRSRDAQHPLTVVASAQTNYQNYMDPKAAKHVANSTTRRGFTGSREISADSGIASIDMAMESSTSSARSVSPPKRSRSRPRNLQMVMSGRHKFEVRDLDDPLSSESSSIVVEPLALPKLPSESQTVPLPLSGLVRSNTVLSRDSNDSEQMIQRKTENGSMMRNLSDDSESREEKLCLDRSVSEKASKQQFRDKNLCSSKTSSPGSSIMVSWCNAAGEALATQDSSIINSITDYNDSSKTLDHIDEKKIFSAADNDYRLELKDDDLNTISSDMNISPMSSNFEPTNSARTYILDSGTAEIPNPERPKSFCDATAIEKRFAEMALAGSAYLIDDETSPTDSLVSSTASDEVVDKKKKHRINEELQEKDIDEISPELEIGSPISPGTPTHASRSLSLSDCGNLIDDEIADQPALLFNTESQPDGLESINSRREKTDTPTLMESVSLRSLKSQSKTRTALQQAIELNLRTPISLRKKVMERAESLDTLSPCESICSDDLMMDFEINSSVDSIDRSTSIKSRSGSDLHKIDETELFSEFEREGSDLMKELNNMLRTHQNNREREKSRVIAHLPARATRLLNRSRLQQQCNFNSDSPDSAKSSNSLRRGTSASSRASSNGSTQHKQHHQHNSPHMQRSQRDSLSSSDDLMLYDKSFRNAMIQDVLHFKKQLLRLRRVLEEAETINPFDAENGQQFNHCGFDLTKDADLISLISSSIDEPIEDISDLRRQVVYLQSQIDDRDRTIRLQRDLIEKLEAEKATFPRIQNATDISKECNNMATQTERTRPLSIGAEGLTRSKPEYTSYTTHFPSAAAALSINHNDLTLLRHQQEEQDQQNLQQSHQLRPIQLPQSQPPQFLSSYSDCSNVIKNNGNYNSTSKSLNQTRRHTIISTTLTNYNTQLAAQAQQTIIPRRASVAWDSKTSEHFPTTTPNPQVYKPVRITLIGDTLKQWNDELLALKNSEKMNILNVNVNKLENYNRTLHTSICSSNGHTINTSHSKSDDLAKNVKANAEASTNKQTISIDTVQMAKPKYQQTNATNISSNGNHSNATVTIV